MADGFVAVVEGDGRAMEDPLLLEQCVASGPHAASHSRGRRKWYPEVVGSRLGRREGVEVTLLGNAAEAAAPELRVIVVV